MPDRYIVFSGYTAYSKNVVELARNADIFVCETMGIPPLQRKEELAEAAAQKKESIGRHVFETHCTTEDVGRMASEAKVKTVVLNHLVGGGGAKKSPEQFESGLIEAVHKFFSGKVIVGRDQMRL
jgi:ribonuclease BN (tRNA processing enzyme)